MSTPERSSTPVSKSGIASDVDGTSFIPSSTRADGSVRKEIRVRPGYKPPEDVEVYKNRTAQNWKSRGKGVVPGAAIVEPTQQKSKSRRGGRKKDVDAKANGAVVTVKTNGVSSEGKGQEKEPEPQPEPEDPEVTKQKEVRKLSKKLRQAKELQQKKKEGDDLLPEQFDKVIKINELIRQLEKLGFDEDGQLKDAQREKPNG